MHWGDSINFANGVRWMRDVTVLFATRLLLADKSG
jgi:hypothetical protein